TNAAASLSRLREPGVDATCADESVSDGGPERGRDGRDPSAGAPASDGPGVAALRSHLPDAARAMADRRADGLFRLAVDRVFSPPGHGTVGTGTVHDGVANVDDEAASLQLLPAGRPVRVRSI